MQSTAIITTGGSANALAAGTTTITATSGAVSGTATLTVTSSVVTGTISLPKTGQTLCYDATGAVIACAGTGQDGALAKGIAWPVPRFIDNANGTVTDNLTRLICLKNANCFSTQIWTAP